MSISQPSAAAAARLKRAPSLVGQVADGLGRQIRDGTFAPGAMLPSVQVLAESWGVSRTVMREALARLSADGLVTSRQGLGVFVASTLPAERLTLTPGADTAAVVRILELRLGLESEAAGFAALRRQPRHLAAMRKALVQMERCVDAADFDKSVAADLDFHRAVCAATGNDHFDALFVFLSQFLHTNIAISRRNSATLRGRGMEAQIEHRAIYEAIEARNANTARRAARQHVLNTARRLGMEVAAEGE